MINKTSEHLDLDILKDSKKIITFYNILNNSDTTNNMLGWCIPYSDIIFWGNIYKLYSREMA